MTPVSEGQILTGAQFNEPVRVETIKQVGPDAWEIGVSGLNSQKFRKVTLSAARASESRLRPARIAQTARSSSRRSRSN
jgi:hypothetical protein